MTVNILGTIYDIVIKKYDEEDCFEKDGINGYCYSLKHQIVLCDMSTYKGWENEPEDVIIEQQKETLRHEIVHAFLNESGLKNNCNSYDNSWARNEEMVDWIALQGEKIYKAWSEVGAL